MQSLEATLSLFFLVLIGSALLEIQEPEIDTTLYKLQLANDVWRVLYLKGDFKDFSFSTLNPSRIKVEKDLEEITDQTNICFFIDGGEPDSQIASCEQDEVGEELVVLEKTLVVDKEPKLLLFKLAHRLSS